MGVKQTEPWDRWPNGDYWTVGILAATPQQLSEHLGLTFTRSEADLGAFALAVLVDDQVGQIWLVSLKASPQPGTDVRVDLGVARDEAMNALWRSTGLDIRSFTWVNPYPAHPWSHRLQQAFGLGNVSLTPRELEIVKLLADGQEAGTIATRLGIAKTTLQTHLAKLRLKFNVQDNAHLRQVIADSRTRQPRLPASA